MFKVRRSAVISDPTYPLICAEYEVLHYDDMPILFTGVNRYGARMLASSVEENDRRKVARFFYLEITTDDYVRFVHRKTSYRDMIVGGRSVFVVDRSFSGESVSTYLIHSNEIPEEYLPGEDSFCPITHARRSLTFGARLTGKLADLHEAVPGDLRVLENSVPGIVTDALWSLGPARIDAKATVQPYRHSSFKLLFNITPHGQLKLIPSMDPYAEYAFLYLDFCLNHFQREALRALSNTAAEAPHFAELLKAHMRIVSTQGGNVNESEIAIDLIAAVRRSVDRLGDLATIVGGNFTSVQLFNLCGDTESFMGSFDPAAATSIATSADQYDKSVGLGTVTDTDPQSYDICVYNLNTETRKGQAWVATEHGMTRVRFVVDGDQSLEQTVFTSSLDRGVSVSVRAFATRADGKLKSLLIAYPEKSAAVP